MLARALLLGNLSFAVAAPVNYPSTSNLANLYNFTRSELLDGLTKGPSWEAIRGQFSKITAPKDPCEADIVSVGLQRPDGIGSRLNTLVADALFALYGGYTISFCVHNGSYGGWYSKHFDSPIPMCTNPDVCGYFPQEPFNHPMWVMSYTVRYCLELSRPSYTDTMLYHIYTKALKLNAETQYRIWTKLRSIGLRQDQEYIGVHIRHGDKHVEADLIPTEAYGRKVTGERVPQAKTSFLATKTETVSRAQLSGTVLAIKEASRKTMITNVFLATDDMQAFEELQGALGQSYTLVSQPSLSPEAYADRSYQSEDIVLSTLADIVGLARSTVFIGTASSTLGQVVRLLRRGKDSISMDNDGTWSRQDYCSEFLDRFFEFNPKYNNTHGYRTPR